MVEPRFSRPVIAALLVAAALFVALAAGQEFEWLAWLDRPGLDRFDSIRTAETTRVVRVVTGLGDGWVLTAAVLLAVAAWHRRRPAAVRYLAVTTLSSALLSPLLKTAFARPRPDEALRLVEAGFYSFPSGHSFGSAVVYGAIAIAAWYGWRRMRMAVTAACLLVVLSVGLSRVYLRVHYPSDVLAGWLAGGAWALLVSCWMLPRSGAGPRPSDSGRRQLPDSAV